MKNYLKILSVDEYSVTPKYLQLLNGVLLGIETGFIVRGDLLPSINDMSYAMDVARTTVEKVYKLLKEMDIVSSVPGKGYYISNTDFKKPVRILLLFNKLSNHKKLIYDSFVETLGDFGAVDFFVYNNDFSLFKRIIQEKLHYNYSKFILISHFCDNESSAHEIINTIPKDRLILMDKLVPNVNGDFASIYEDFQSDIYCALKELLEQLRKYQTIYLLFPENSYYPKEIQQGFINFCNEFGFDYQVINAPLVELESHSVYISLMEDDLITLIEQIVASNLKVGKDIGVISYNETAIKKIILDGITTISTDFQLMGKKTAEMVINNQRELFALPFKVTLRNSL